MTYSDATLQDYLAGNLSAEDASVLEAAVENDPELEARLIALDAVGADVASVFLQIPEQARLDGIDVPVQKVAVAQSGSFRWLGLVAAAAVGAALGMTALNMQGPKTPEWHQQVAAYQSLYVPDTVAAISGDANSLQEQLKVAGAALDLELPQEVLSGLEGLTLKRAQILGFAGRELIQIAFQAEDGTPIAFCILKGGAPRAEEMEISELSGLASAAWASDTHGYLLIGGSDSALIADVGSRLQRVF